MLKIYCMHQIAGLTPVEVFGYYSRTQKILADVGYDVYIPMYNKKSLKIETVFKEANYSNPVATNHAIYNRDRWMVEQSDILYANLLEVKKVSIGCMFELAWGSQLHKHIVLVMEKDNIHNHAFVLEAATVIFETEEEAISYLTSLSKKEL